MKILNITVESKVALGASATFNGQTYNTAQRANLDKIRAYAYANQAGTLNIQQSVDGTNFRTTSTTAVSLGTAKVLEDMICCPYVRVQFVNGATANTAFEITSVLY